MTIEISEFIEACGGKPADAARRLGVSRQVIYSWQQAGIPDSALFDGGKKTATHIKMYQVIRRHKTKGKRNGK